MAAAKRRTDAPAESPAVPREDRQAIVFSQFRRDLAWWIGSNPRTALRVMRLVEESSGIRLSGQASPKD
jgi:hypothetical protein